MKINKQKETNTWGRGHLQGVFFKIQKFPNHQPTCVNAMKGKKKTKEKNLSLSHAKNFCNTNTTKRNQNQYLQKSSSLSRTSLSFFWRSQNSLIQFKAFKLPFFSKEHKQNKSQTSPLTSTKKDKGKGKSHSGSMVLQCVI